MALQRSDLPSRPEKCVRTQKQVSRFRKPKAREESVTPLSLPETTTAITANTCRGKAWASFVGVTIAYLTTHGYTCLKHFSPGSISKLIVRLALYVEELIGPESVNTIARVRSAIMAGPVYRLDRFGLGFVVFFSLMFLFLVQIRYANRYAA